MNKEVLISCDLLLQMQGSKLLNYPSKSLNQCKFSFKKLFRSPKQLHRQHTDQTPKFIINIVCPVRAGS